MPFNANPLYALESSVNSTFEFVLGPIWTRWGFQDHSLLLRSDEIVDVPYSAKGTLRHVLSLHLPFIADPGESVRLRALEGKVSEKDLLSFRAVRYPVEVIEQIRVECRWTQNQIVLITLGETPRIYRLHHRNRTDACRSAFRSLYPTLYTERGFEDSLIGRLRKL